MLCMRLSDWLLLWQWDCTCGYRWRWYNWKPFGGSAHVLQWRLGEGQGLYLQSDRAGGYKQIQGERHIHALIYFGPSNPLHGIRSTPVETPDIPLISNTPHQKCQVTCAKPDRYIPAPQSAHWQSADRHLTHDHVQIKCSDQMRERCLASVQTLLNV